ncbi:hypothetical protein DNU06_10625 [Putridiphycobacter roseus]|uniref:Uncharacterized protein n=1 Tax=Putridiphycobacter roseus TaxID=2219161 RepID=A0A2W1NQ08_9FLAO|nr:hypothetical protein [Putridiphycobacter roseus]PZE16708.1 hypothetical protein DNU06_10625 [Putridiphycobacter roseus]
MKIFYLACLLTLFTACQPDLTPSWLVIDDFTFTTNVTVEGENSEEIVDAWVYLDGKSMGTWEIPLKMPILEEGEHELQVFAGIKDNGEGDTRVNYEFYTSYSTTIQLKKEEITAVKPEFKYKSGLSFAGKEDFEDTGNIFGLFSSDDSTKIVSISKNDYPNIVKYGNNCGMIKLSNIDTSFTIITAQSFLIKQTEVYLELDYLSTNSFTIGILDATADGTESINSPHVGLYATDSNNFEWKHAYFPLTYWTNVNTLATYYELYLYGSIDDNNTEGVIYLDNIRIVSY